MEIHKSLDVLCENLEQMLHHSEVELLNARDRLEQAQYVMKPWPNLKYSKTLVECNCNRNETNMSENSEDLALINNISKVLTNAEALRTDPLKLKAKNSKTSKSNLTKPSTSTAHCSTSKTNLKLHNKDSSCTVIKRKSVQKLKSDIKLHKPSCPLYKANGLVADDACYEHSPYLELSDAVVQYKIPQMLIRTIEQSYELFDRKPQLNHSKDDYFKLFQKQNDEIWHYHARKDPTIDTLSKYLTTYDKFTNKSKSDYFPWIFFNKAEDLLKYQSDQSNIGTKEFWIEVLKYINSTVIPVLKESEFELETKEKLYIYKTIKTICNYIHCNKPVVPIFRVHYK